MVDFGKFSHHLDFSFVLRDLIEHLLFHELDSDDSILREMIAFVDYSVVSFSQLFRTINVEIVVHALHALHRIQSF